jgi:hypothetical protein
MNLAVLKKSRRAPQVGDIFVMLPPDGRYLFGRVISTDANPLGVGGAILYYVYRVRSIEKSPPAQFDRTALLIPPGMVNRLPWSRGYFEFVENRPLAADERLEQHCFKDSRGWYFDELGERLADPTEPVGTFGLQSFRTVDDRISAALGIPFSAD